MTSPTTLAIHAVLDQMSDALVIFDRQWRYTYVNRAAVELLQRSPEELLGKNVWTEVFPSEVGGMAYRELQRAMAEQVVVSWEEFGEPVQRWLEVKAEPNPDGIALYFRDITKQRQPLETSFQNSDFIFRTLIDNIPGAVYRCQHAPEWPVMYFSDGIEAIVGHPALDFSDQGSLTYGSLIFPEDREAVEYLVDLAVQARQPFELEYRLIHADGSLRWVYEKGQGVFDTTGKLLYLDGVIFDITERKSCEIDRQRMELTLRQSQNQLAQQLAELEAIYQSAPIGLAVLDRDLRFIRINERLAEMNGLPVAAHLGRTVREVLPELAPSAEQILRPILTTGEPRLKVELVGETPALPGVQRIWLEHFLPLKQEDQVIGISIVCEEITDRKLAELALRESERRYAMLAATVPVAIFRFDTEGNCVYVSDRWSDLTGQPVEVALGQGWVQTLHPEDRDRMYQAWRQWCQSQSSEIYQNQGRCLHSDGRITWFYAQAATETDIDGRVRGYVGSLTDITAPKQIEANLRESEQRFRQLAENISEAVFWISDPIQRQVLYVSPAYEQIWQHSCASLYANFSLWSESIHPQDRQRIRRIFAEQVLQGGYDEEYRIVRPDGSIRWIRDRGFPIRDAAGNSYRAVGIAEDISDRKLAEQSLRDSEARFKLALQATGTVYWERDLKQDQLLISGNFTAPGIPQTLTYQAALDWVHPDDRDSIEQAYATVLAKFARPETLPQDVGIQQNHFIEITHRLREPEDKDWRWVLARGNVMTDTNGQPTRIVGVSIDITPLKQVEAALRENKRLLKLALASAQAGSWSWEIATDTKVWSPENYALYGFEPTQPLSYAAWLNSLHPGDRDAMEALVRQIITTRQPKFRTEFRILHPQLGVRWLMGLGRLICDDHGEPVQMCGINLDITDRKLAEQEREHLLERERIAREAAEAANRVKDDFLTVLSHELRSPLNPILGWANLLQNRQLSPEKTAQGLSAIEDNAKLLTQLIDDLLDMARILRGKLALKTAPVHLANVIMAALQTVQFAIDAKGLQLTTTLDTTIGPVLGDATRLQQVVWNLLTNAVKFTPPGGQIEITLSLVPGHSSPVTEAQKTDEGQKTNDKKPKTNYAQITVSDTGKGILPEFLPHIFEYFRQEDGSTTRQHGGLGLGLAICRQLVEMHGGTIQAQSPGEGCGATFIVQLPLLSLPVDQPLDQALHPVESRPSSAHPLQGLQILVVDDDLATRNYLATLLEAEQAIVTTAASAQQALLSLTQFQPDILLCDIGMPKVDGYRLLRQLRRSPSPQLQQLPAIALTAYATESDRQQALTAGFQCHLAKPAQPQDVIAAIANLVGRGGAPPYPCS